MIKTKNELVEQLNFLGVSYHMKFENDELIVYIPRADYKRCVNYLKVLIPENSGIHLKKSTLWQRLVFVWKGVV